MAQALKAVAASREIKLKRHSDLEKFARILAMQEKDRAIYDIFQKANYLHSNFYETGLSLEDVSISAEDIRRMVVKLLEFNYNERPD